MFGCMPVMSRSEDYLKTIYALASRGEPVTTSGLALELGVSSPSVSAMAKRLHTEALLQRPGGGWVLTQQGERAALRVIRRHRLVETFLARALGMGWDEVHAEAEVLEHVLSDRLEERIDTALGHPTHDPHGDPIPPRHGHHTEAWATLWTPHRRGADSGSSGSPTGTARRCATSAPWASAPGWSSTSKNRSRSGARGGFASTVPATPWAPR